MPYETAEEMKARLEEAFGEDYPVAIETDQGGFPLSLRFFGEHGEPLDPPFGIIAKQVQSASAFDSFVNTMKGNYDRYRSKQV